MKLSELIRLHREEAGFTQSELAERLHISRQSISKWETGVSLPDVDNLIALADELDLSLDELIRGSQYFSKPFVFGTILNRWVIISLFIGTLSLIAFTTLNSFTDLFETSLIFSVLCIGALLIIMISPGPMQVIDEKWVVTRNGIEYQNIINPFLRIYRLVRFVFTGKDDVAQVFLPYDDILSVETRLSTRSLYGNYFYRYEYKAAGLTLSLKNGKVIYLDIPDRFEQYLPHALSYFEEKNIQICDPNNTLRKILIGNYLRHIDFYDYYNYDINEKRQTN